MKIKSFLLLGVVTVLSSNVLGATTINSTIDNIIKNQYEKGFLSEKVDIIIENKKGNIQDTNFQRFKGACLVNLSFDKKGNIPFLGNSKKNKIETAPKNENQKIIMQEYAALHESYHCEFSNIENPIQYSNNQNKINLYLKDIKTIPNIKSVSYQIALSENFSDVAAFVSLIKKYGVDNKDLLFVMNSIKEQREDLYKVKQGDHSTHFALEELFKTNNLNKIAEIKTPKDFKDFVLNISNFGTKKIFENNSDYNSEESISSAFFYSVLIEAANIKAIEFGITEDKGIWKYKSSKINEVANNFLNLVDIKKTKNINELIEQVFISADNQKSFFNEKTKDFLEETLYFYKSFENKAINISKYRDNNKNNGLNLKF